MINSLSGNNSISDSIIIAKIAWSYNGWTGFDNQGYENRGKFGFEHIKNFGIAHEWWSFHDFGGDYYLGHIETGDRSVRSFDNNGLILIASVNPDKKGYYLVGFYGKAELGQYSLPSNLWDTLTPDKKEQLENDAKAGLIDKSAPDDLKQRVFFNWRAEKNSSARFKKFIPFDTKDFGVPVWGRAPYIVIGRNPGKFTKEQIRALLIRALEEHKKLLADSTESEKPEIEDIINKTETVLGLYFTDTVSRNYWQIAPGPQASSWPLCVEKGIIPIFFNDILGNIPDNILNFSKEQLIEHCQKNAPQIRDGQIKTRVGAIWDFIHNIQSGDYVLSNKGQSLALGWGIITSDAKICREGTEISFYRKVDWKNPALNKPLDPELGRHFFTAISPLRKDQFESVVYGSDMTLPENPLFTKIQNILDYKKQVILYGPPGTGKTWTVRNFVDGKRRLEPEIKTITTDKKFFWFSANPALWDPNNLWRGEETDLWYGSIRSAFNDIEAGDFVFVYVSKDQHRISGIATCSKKEFDANNIPRVFIKGLQQIDGPEWSQIKDDSILSTAKPVRMGARGTLFPLNEYEGLRLLEMAGLTAQSVGLLVEEQEEKIDNCTFVAFHPSYSYEEFIEGLRPEKDENGSIYYKVQEGIFKSACRTAYNSLLREAEIDDQWEEDTGVPHLDEGQIQKVREMIDRVPVYFVIDEINRGDISRIFGELITLIESDKRLFMDTPVPCILPYSKQEFGIPPNLYILGTMNTADRSISLMDIALRRRFGFCELPADYDALNRVLLADTDLDPEVRKLRELSITLLKVLNSRLVEKYDRDHQIGHSYLIGLAKEEEADATKAALENIWRYEVIPLLQEYFFDSPEKLLSVLNERFFTRNGSSFAERPEPDFIAALEAVARQKEEN